MVRSLWDEGFSRQEIAEQVRHQFGLNAKDFNARHVHGFLSQMDGLVRPYESGGGPFQSLRKKEESQRTDVVAAVEAGKDAFKEGMTAAQEQTIVAAEAARRVAEAAREVAEAKEAATERQAAPLIEVLKMLQQQQKQPQDNSAILAVITAQGQQMMQGLQMVFRATMESMQKTMEAVVKDREKSKDDQVAMMENFWVRMKEMHNENTALLKNSLDAQLEHTKSMGDLQREFIKQARDSLDRQWNLMREFAERERGYIEEMRGLLMEAVGGEAQGDSSKSETRWMDVIGNVLGRGLQAFQQKMQERQGEEPQPQAVAALPQPTMGEPDMGLKDSVQKALGWLTGGVKGILRKVVEVGGGDVIRSVVENLALRAEAQFPPEETFIELKALAETGPWSDSAIKNIMLYPASKIVDAIDEVVGLGDFKDKKASITEHLEKVREIMLEYYRTRIPAAQKAMEEAMKQAQTQAQEGQSMPNQAPTNQGGTETS